MAAEGGEARMVEPRECGICRGVIVELGMSPFCEGCCKLMCESCEGKHDKDECKIERQGERRFGT